MSKRPSIIQDYFAYQEEYTKLYGSDTIVFMRIGDFYEAYQTNERGFDLSRIAEATDLTKTKKNNNIEEVSDKNPHMMGFIYVALRKFLKKLVNKGFTVVIVDQVTAAPHPKREVTGVYTAGTYIDDNNNS